MLRHILIAEFRRFIEKVDKERRLSDETTTDDLEQRIEETTAEIDGKIRKLKQRVPQEGYALTQLQRLVVNLGRLVDQAKAMAKEYEDDRSKFVHLAGIGLIGGVCSA